MQLTRLTIENFRCFQDRACLDIDNFTVLIGKNDVGKSTIMDALALFFEKRKHDKDDRSVSSNTDTFSITCEFNDLPDTAIIDATNPTSLKDEFLVNRRRCLEITKQYDTSKKTMGKPLVKVRANHPTHQHLKDLMKLNHNALKRRADDLGIDTQNIRRSVNADLRRAIRGAVSKAEWECQEREFAIAEFKGEKDLGKKLMGLLPEFMIFKADRTSTDQDPEAQSPIKQAVAEAITSMKPELEVIKEQVIAEIRSIIDATLKKMKLLDPGLASDLKPEFPEPTWARTFKVNLRDDKGIAINRRGSGVRRLLLLAFLQAQAERLVAESDRSIIYAIEEPETSLHPDKQRDLVSTMLTLAEDRSNQIMTTTHSPNLARRMPLSSIRYLEQIGSTDPVIRSGDDGIYPSVAEALGVLADHNVRLFLGVEGANDIEFLKRISALLAEQEERIVDLAREEERGHIILMSLGGSNLAHWTSTLRELPIPEFYIFDSDKKSREDEGMGDKAKAQERAAEKFNARPGCEVRLTSKREMENYIHPDAIRDFYRDEHDLDVEVTFGDFEKVPDVVACRVYEARNPGEVWAALEEEKQGKKVSKVKKHLNKKCIRYMTPELLDAQDTEGDIRGWLAYIGEKVAEGSEHGEVGSQEALEDGEISG